MNRLSAIRSVSHDSSGGFVVVRTSVYQDLDGAGVFGQRFDSSGSPVGSEFQVNTDTTGDQFDPSVSGDPSGGFVVAWESWGQDGDGGGVYGQRYIVQAPPTPSLSAPGALGLAVLLFGIAARGLRVRLRERA